MIVQKKFNQTFGIIAFLLVLSITPVYAAEINVGNGNVADLIQAINDANSDVIQDTIILDGSTFTLTEVNNVDDVEDDVIGPTGLPIIMSEIVVQGNGSTIERDQNADNFRIKELDLVNRDNSCRSIQRIQDLARRLHRLGL